MVLLEEIRSFFKNKSTAMCVKAKISQSISVDVGVRQGV